MITTAAADLLRGALDLEATAHGVLPHRLPRWARAPVGGRLAGQATVDGGNALLVAMSTASAEHVPGPGRHGAVRRAPGRHEDVETWLPRHESTGTPG